MSPLLTAAEAAELLAVPPSWLLAQARAGQVPHVRLGRYVRFDRDQLAAWVAERAA
jgi:excisionase family DNA binding protein